MRAYRFGIHSVLALLLCLGAAGQVWADAFEQVAGDAREAALGGNLVAAAEGANMILANPALLGELATAEIKVTRHDLFGLGLLLQDTFGFVYPWPILGLGVAYNRLSTNNLGFIDYSEHSFFFSAGTRIGQDFDVGMTTKFLYVDFEEPASGWGTILGANYRPIPNLNVAFSLDNLVQGGANWITRQRDQLPRKVSLGVNGKWLQEQLFTSVSVDHSLEASVQPQFHGGAELRLFENLLDVRGGFYNIEDNWNLTFGLGVNYAGVKLEYAFMPHYELGNAHIFSLAIEL